MMRRTASRLLWRGGVERKFGIACENFDTLLQLRDLFVVGERLDSVRPFLKSPFAFRQVLGMVVDAKYPGQFQVYSPYTYDAVGVLVDAMVKAGSTDPKVYGAQLFKTDYQGVTTKVGFEADGELKNPAMSLYEYKDGKKVSLN